MFFNSNLIHKLINFLKNGGSNNYVRTHPAGSRWNINEKDCDVNGFNYTSDGVDGD